MHGHGAIILRFVLDALRQIGGGGEISTELIRSSCSPTLNGLQSASGLLNGPASVPFMPSGNNGRCRKPTARSLNAIEPLRPMPSADARVTYEPKPAAVSLAAASVARKKV